MPKGQHTQISLLPYSSTGFWPQQHYLRPSAAEYSHLRDSGAFGMGLAAVRMNVRSPSPSFWTAHGRRVSAPWWRFLVATPPQGPIHPAGWSPSAWYLGGETKSQKRWCCWADGSSSSSLPSAFPVPHPRRQATYPYVVLRVPPSREPKIIPTPKQRPSRPRAAGLSAGAVRSVMTIWAAAGGRGLS